MAGKSTAEKLILEGIRVLDQAYNDWKLEGFMKAENIFQRAIDAQPDDFMAWYWKGTALFHQATYYLHARKKDKVPNLGEKCVDEGIKSLSRSIEENPRFSESHALRGVLRGMKINLNRWTVFSHGLGVKSDRDKAIELSPENPRVHYLTGISFWMAPDILGGKKHALPHLMKAEKLYESEMLKERSPLEPNWGYHTCLAFIGDVYCEQRKYSQARIYYEKALSVNPYEKLAREGLEKIRQTGY
jgi:tetratricopeptide (TPR) repeat protein